MAEGMVSAVLDATLGIGEQYNERRKTIQDQITQGQQMLMQAQAMCSQGNQGACQSIGALNSRLQMLKADLDRLDQQEEQDKQKMAQQGAGSAYEGSFRGSVKPGHWNTPWERDDNYRGWDIYSQMYQTGPGGH